MVYNEIETEGLISCSLKSNGEGPADFNKQSGPIAVSGL